MSAGSSNESARDCLTKSSRLVVFCSSSNSFMASTVLRAYLLPALTAVSTIPLISASLDHPLVHLDHCCPLDSLSFHFTAFYLSAYPFVLPSALSLWLTACCGTETAPDWRCLSPQGAPGPTSSLETGPQGGAAPAWPHTTCMSSSREKKEHHQRCSVLCIPVWLAVKLPLSVQFTQRKGFVDYFSGFCSYLSFSRGLLSPLYIGSLIHHNAVLNPLYVWYENICT